MPRLGLRAKLLTAFLIILLPMLALIVYDYNADFRHQGEEIVDAQLRTSQAIAALVDAGMDDAFAAAWSFSKDPILRTMDSRQIDPYLQDLAPWLPQLDDIAVLDLEGTAVGLMARQPPDVPRPSGADRPYFQAVKSTRQPAISDTLISRSSGSPVVVAAVPMLDDSETLRGVTLAALDLDFLARRVETVGVRKSQAIFATDPNGTVAFHTLLPREEWGRRSLADYRPIQSALREGTAQEPEMLSPMGDVRIVAATRTARYGWVVGVSVPRSAALQPVRADLAYRLLLFSIVVVLAGLGGTLLWHRLILRPLETLRGRLIAFGPGQRESRLELHTGDEMEELAAAFNRMAEEIRDHEQMQMDYLHMVSHDLRIPLTAIHGYAQILSLKLTKLHEEDLHTTAERIVANSSRMNIMIQELIDAARLEVGQIVLQRRPVELRSFVFDSLDRARAGIDVERIRVEIPADLPPVDADPTRLERILLNLLTNALKFSPSDTDVLVKAERTDTAVRTSVTDLGMGIAPEDLPHLFDRFYRAKEASRAEGLGLGLFITRMLVEAQGGRVWAHSELGRGSTFFFTLPVDGASDPEVRLSESGRKKEGHHCHG